MKRLRETVTALAALVLVAGCAAGSAGGGASGPAYTELLGTWVGPAYAEGDDEGTELTLVLTEENGALAGRMSAPAVMMESSPIREVVFEEGILLFTIDFAAPDGTMLQINWELRKEGESLNGTFSSEMIGGIVTLRKVG